MRKGYLRASGGSAALKLSYRVSIRSMRCMQKPHKRPRLTSEELGTLRGKLRHSIRFYLAQKKNTVRYGKGKEFCRTAKLYARRVEEKSDSTTWREKLSDLLHESRYREEHRRFRSDLYRIAGVRNIGALEEALDDGEELRPGHLETLRAFANLHEEPSGVTKSADPALMGLLSVIGPVWTQVTGWSTWPRAVEDRQKSRIWEWLDDQLGRDAPTNDQVISTLAKLRN